VITDTTQAKNKPDDLISGAFCTRPGNDFTEAGNSLAVTSVFRAGRHFELTVKPSSSLQNRMNWSKTTVVILQHISVSFIQNML
jgi:hypothetical protein